MSVEVVVLIEKVLVFFAVSAIAYPVIALMLVGWPARQKISGIGRAAGDFQSFVDSGSFAQPAQACYFTARDGALRLYRLYGDGGDLMIFLHGSGSGSRYLARYASTLADKTPLRIATLDMRGHGPQPIRRGDVDYIDQQEHDIADLAKALQEEFGWRRLFVGGHSIGGGLAIRYAAGDQTPRPDGLLLMSPYVHRKAPSARPGSGGWAAPRVTRFAGIEMLHRLGVHVLDRLPVIEFAIGAAARDGNETAHYSWRLFTSVTPRADWQRDVAAINCPLLVIGAERDAIFNPAGFKSVFSQLPQADTHIFPGIGHFELSLCDEAAAKCAIWLRRHTADRCCPAKRQHRIDKSL